MPGEGAAMLTSDRSCTAHLFSSDGLLPDGTPYVWFRNFEFIGTTGDGGPSSLSRTREGYIEIIAMADVSEPLLSALHPGGSGMPADCAVVQLGSVVAPSSVSTRPSGGLIGAASIINVAQGTLLATRAEALGGFTAVSLYTGPGDIAPNLASVHDDVLGGKATATLFDSEGRVQQLSYGGPGVTTSQPIDAVSAVLMADSIYNEYVVSPGLKAGSDWVLTFPTKHFYVDPLVAGPGAGAREPFFKPFENGKSPVGMGERFYNREGRTPHSTCWIVVCEPSFEVVADYAVNVMPFYTLADTVFTESAVLHSRLLVSTKTMFGDLEPHVASYEAGWLQLSSQPQGYLPEATSGEVLCGLPVVGFWATNLVNSAVSEGVLSNYSAAVRHARSTACFKGDNTTPTPCN